MKKMCRNRENRERNKQLRIQSRGKPSPTDSQKETPRLPQKCKNDANRLEKIHSLLYSFTQTKFREVLKIKEIKYLFREICDRVGVDDLIHRNSALSEDPEQYKTQLQKIISEQLAE